MKVRGHSESVAPFEKCIYITDYITRHALLRNADIWVQQGSEFEEFAEWVQGVVISEYSYWLNQVSGETFVVEFISFSNSEILLLDALWYG